MSEFDYSELDDVEGEFLPEATDLSPWEDAAAPRQPADSITSRFFDEQGRPREVPQLEDVGAFDAWWQAEQERGQPDGPPVDSLVFGQPPQSYEQDEFDRVAQLEARQRASASAYAQASYGLVEHLAGPYGVTDPRALQEVTDNVEAFRKSYFEGELARGASVAQAIAGLDELHRQGFVQQQIEAHLEAARYEQRTKNTLMRKQQQFRDRELERRGEPVLSLFEKYPGLEKMARSMQAKQARLDAWNDGVAQVVARNRAQGEAAARQSAAAPLKTRKLHL